MIGTTLVTSMTAADVDIVETCLSCTPSIRDHLGVRAAISVRMMRAEDLHGRRRRRSAARPAARRRASWAAPRRCRAPKRREPARRTDRRSHGKRDGRPGFSPSSMFGESHWAWGLWAAEMGVPPRWFSSSAKLAGEHRQVFCSGSLLGPGLIAMVLPLVCTEKLRGADHGGADCPGPGPRPVGRVAPVGERMRQPAAARQLSSPQVARKAAVSSRL